MLLHNYFLAPLYKQNTSLWRPLNQMNIALVFLIRLVLLGTFVATYAWLVRPRTLGGGIVFGSPHRPRSWSCGGVRHLYSLTYSAGNGMGVVYRGNCKDVCSR